MRCRLLSAGLLLLPLIAHAQEPPVETLHVTSQLVEVSAVVTDRQGAPRTGLTKDDFILKQDGKEQPIRYFSQGDELPLTFIVMIDTSGSQRTFIDDEQRACDLFFESVLGRRPQDRAALIEVNSQVMGRSNLTDNPNQLHLALYSVHFDPDKAQETRLNDAIVSVSHSLLSQIRGRKAIILISDGGDHGSLAKVPDAVAEAQRDNVPIYAVSYSAWRDIDPIPSGAAGNYSMTNRYAMGSDPGLKNLNDYAKGTGGQVYEVSNNRTLAHIFQSIATELGAQYEIGYMLPPDTKPKQFHKLELKAKDKSLRVQARTGFYTTP